MFLGDCEQRPTPHAKAQGANSVCRAEDRESAETLAEPGGESRDQGQKGQQVTAGPTSSQTRAFLPRDGRPVEVPQRSNGSYQQ